MRLLTYNIHKGIGGRDRRYRLERIIGVIEHENPDIICLQEVDHNMRRTRFSDQPYLLSAQFVAATKLFQLNVPLKYGGYGNLLLSRFPLETKHQISLRLGRRKQRGAQLAVLQTPEGPLHVVHCHLGLAEHERHWQVLHLLSHHLFREGAELPTIFAGDTNDWRNTLERGIFSGYGFEQVTKPISRYRTFPAYFSLGSLDKVFTRGAIHVTGARIVRSKLAKQASDHLPLVVDFHLKKP